MARFTVLRNRAAMQFYIWRYRLSLVPMILSMRPVRGADGAADADGDNAGAGDGDNSDAGGDGDSSKKKTDDTDDDADGSAGAKAADDPDWKSESRKHENRAKSSAKRVKELEKQLKEREDADKTEQEKALEKARDEGRTEAQTAAEKERRHDRLDIAATKTAVKGVKVDGDDGESVVSKFADPDDAIIYIERGIKNGDIDEDELFDDDGKVRSGPLVEALTQILSEKPHLAARSADTSADKSEKKDKPSGDSDAGKGSPGKSTGEKSAKEILEAQKRG